MSTPAAPPDQHRLEILLRARHPCLSITTEDEDRVLELAVAAALAAKRTVQVWSAGLGVREGLFPAARTEAAETVQLAPALRWWCQSGQSRVLILLDPVGHLDHEPTLRALRDAILHCRTCDSTLVLVDPRQPPGPVLAAAAIFTPGLPDEAELASHCRTVLARLRGIEPFAVELTQAQFKELVRQLRGLTRAQAEQVVRDIAMEDQRLDQAKIAAAAAAKRRLLRGRGLLETVEAPVDMDEVAGMESLKRWLALRRSCFAGGTAPAGLEQPRGVLVLGVPGTGKSLVAKAAARAWDRPLVRLDAGVLYDRWVGESEARLREALRQAEAQAPLVLWIDEIEKAFASASAQNTDGGLSQRLFATLLTWMQERRAAVFLVATANLIEALPAELLRKGRFDEIFFVDLPDAAARRELLAIHLRRRALDPAAFDLDALVAASDRRSGAEIEAAVVTGLIEAHAAGTALDAARLAAALTASPPLAETMAERLAHLRAWARGRCVMAG